ncbi:hypothetical protein ES703_69455 [subsurface metagenome]
MRLSIIFFALCSALDEATTFTHLYLGGVELNPRVAWLLSINPLLYTLADIGLILLFVKVDKWRRGIRDLWIIWASAGIARLVCVAFSIS